jgi:hypothetical protein
VNQSKSSNSPIVEAERVTKEYLLKIIKEKNNRIVNAPLNFLAFIIPNPI